MTEKCTNPQIVFVPKKLTSVKSQAGARFGYSTPKDFQTVYEVSTARDFTVYVNELSGSQILWKIAYNQKLFLYDLKLCKQPLKAFNYAVEFEFWSIYVAFALLFIVFHWSLG